MNCAPRPMSVCANARVTGQKKTGVLVAPVIGAVSERARRNAERHLERGANYD
jgi:hypothetical protein